MLCSTAPKSLQSCPTMCDPIDGSPPGSPVPGILQARTLEWVAISFSNAWKWKVKVKSLSHVWLLATPWTAAHQLLRPWDFPGKSTGVGCHCLPQCYAQGNLKLTDSDLMSLRCWVKCCRGFWVVLYQSWTVGLVTFVPTDHHLRRQGSDSSMIKDHRSP